MGTVISNERVANGVHLLSVRREGTAAAGQFFMLRARGMPLLGRPLSVHDSGGAGVSFLFRVAGEGTAILADARPGDELELEGPHGRGFLAACGPMGAGTRVALVGGGLGIAPLYLAARELRAHGARVTAFLGFSGEPFLEDRYRAVADSVEINVGGFVTDLVDGAKFDVILACGPAPMMRAMHVARGDARLFVSLERRMACGCGVCLGCSFGTTRGRARVCAEGPVFPSEEVFDDVAP